jgi:hypothetical protein
MSNNQNIISTLPLCETEGLPLNKSENTDKVKWHMNKGESGTQQK